MKLPSAIIFVNSDMNDQMQTTIEKQLYVHNTMTGDDFDLLISNDPSYVDQVNLNDLRVLVIRDDIATSPNNQYADVVMFVSHGIASIEKNKFGPPIPQLKIMDLNIYALLRAAGSDKVITLPNWCNDCQTRGCGCGCNNCGLLSCNGCIYDGIYDLSGVNCPNNDNHYTNYDWLNRK